MRDGRRTSVWSHRPLVELHLPLSEVGKLLEGIDGDQNRANVGLGGGTASRTRTGNQTSKCGEANAGHDRTQCCYARLASDIINQTPAQVCVCVQGVGGANVLFGVQGYEDVVVHVSLLQVVGDGVLVDLAQQHHVVHAAHLHVLGLPMVALLATLWGAGHDESTGEYRWDT